jgi:hypothetical protein
MSTGAVALAAIIDAIDSLRTLNERVAKEAEAGVLAAARSTAAAGEAPSGQAWAERAEGGKALDGAATAIEVSTKGPRIDLKIGPPWVFHNRGAGGSSTTKEAERHRKRAEARRVKGGTKSKFHAPRRQIIPTAGEPIPAPMKEAIADAAARVFGKAVG